jgi:immunity protein Imm6 of predicted polymorphic toxin system
MTSQTVGHSQLAELAGGLSDHAQVGLALLAGDAALDHLKSSREVRTGHAAFDLARRWYDGEETTPRQIEEALQNEDDEGVIPAAQAAASDRERAAWLALASALLFIAYQAYRARGEHPGPLVSEVREDELDELDRQLRALSPDLPGTLTKAAALLRQDPALSFSQLKAKAS